MKKKDPFTHVKPSADRQQNRPLDIQAAEPGDIDPTQPSNRGDQRMPHEHDESPETETQSGKSAPPPRQVVEQAASDITRGLRDTERRGTPSDVPAPGPSPENSPGGKVPDAGIDRESTATHAEQMKKKDERKP